MAKEIERKFLVTDDSWRGQAVGVHYRQAYLSRTPERTVRVRTIREQGFLTIKGLTSGATRTEFEYEIPHADAVVMLEELCEQPVLEKNRYTLEYAGFVWEIDEFLADNHGLVVAEIELEHESQPFARPGWTGKEVTGDVRYYNSSLSRVPFSRWRARAQK